jgi:MoaA/NifB/PqqE/SkfB family radical SAM enzyme
MIRILTPTFRCNLRCKFCMVSGQVLQAGADPAFESLTEQLKDLRTGDFVYLYGGEPTLYRDFFRLLEVISSRGLAWSIATNGVRFASRAFTERVAAAGSGDVRVSIHGADSQTHDATTGVKGSFERLRRGIANIVEARIPLILNAVPHGRFWAS